MLCLAVDVSISVAIYVLFGSIYHNLSELGSCVCDVSCIGASRESWKITIVLASHPCH